MSTAATSRPEQRLAHEQDRHVELEVGVVLAREAVPFVFRAQIPDAGAVRAHLGDDLLGLRVGNARVVPALDDEQRLGDPGGVGERRDPQHEVAHRRIALVAVLDTPQVAPVALGVLQKTDEVRDADDVDRAGDPVGVVGRHRQAHVAAVASARHHHPSRIEAGLERDPVEQGTDVLDRILALDAVVERKEGLAEARRAAHVRPDHGDAELFDEVVVAAEKAELRLTLGTAVDIDENRPATAEASRRCAQQPRDLAPVEAPPADDRLLAEPGCVDTRRRVRGRPSLHGAVGGVDDRDRARRRAALVGDGEPGQARMEVGIGDAAVRQLRGGQLVEGVRVEEANLVAALDVGAYGEQAAGRVEADVDNIPGDASADGGCLRIAEAIEHQLAEFAAAIADEEQARAVALPRRGEVGRWRSSRCRQDLALGAGREIEQPDLRLQRRHVARQRDGRVVPRHPVGRPAAAGQIGEATPRLRPHRVHQPERLRDLLATAAARGSVERHRQVEQLARTMQPALHVVALAGLGEARRLLARQVEAIELRRLVAAAAAFEDDVVAVDRLVAGPGHRLAAVGQRLGIGERAGDAGDLRRVDAGAAMRDEHLASRRVPVHEPMAAKVGVARDGAGDARRNRRDFLGDQVGVGNDDVTGRRRRLRRRQGCTGSDKRDGHTGRGESRSVDRDERHRHEKGRRLDGGALIVVRRDRAGAARGGARQARAGVVCWMPAIAHSRLPSAGLTRCQTSSNGSATPLSSSRMRP
jgi:hypothetical protein